MQKLTEKHTRNSYAKTEKDRDILVYSPFYGIQPGLFDFHNPRGNGGLKGLKQITTSLESTLGVVPDFMVWYGPPLVETNPNTCAPPAALASGAAARPVQDRVVCLPVPVRPCSGLPGDTCRPVPVRPCSGLPGRRLSTRHRRSCQTNTFSDT